MPIFYREFIRGGLILLINLLNGNMKTNKISRRGGGFT